MDRGARTLDASGWNSEENSSKCPARQINSAWQLISCKITFAAQWFLHKCTSSSCRGESRSAWTAQHQQGATCGKIRTILHVWVCFWLFLFDHFARTVAYLAYSWWCSAAKGCNMHMGYPSWSSLSEETRHPILEPWISKSFLLSQVTSLPKSPHFNLSPFSFCETNMACLLQKRIFDPWLTFFCIICSGQWLTL